MRPHHVGVHGREAPSFLGALPLCAAHCTEGSAVSVSGSVLCEDEAGRRGQLRHKDVQTLLAL